MGHLSPLHLLAGSPLAQVPGRLLLPRGGLSSHHQGHRRRWGWAASRSPSSSQLCSRPAVPAALASQVSKQQQAAEMVPNFNSANWFEGGTGAQGCSKNEL